MNLQIPTIQKRPMRSGGCAYAKQILNSSLEFGDNNWQGHNFRFLAGRIL